MTTTPENAKYDDVLSSILVNEKSILGFLSTIFNFLARRTDFYYVPEGKYENIGFPPGVAEELVLKVIRACDPKNIQISSDLNDDIMCSTVAQEVEVEGEEEIIPEREEEEIVPTEQNSDNSTEDKNQTNCSPELIIPEAYQPPIVPTQSNSDSYNGAVRDKYAWSQTIMEIDVTIPIPPDIKSKDLKVIINSNDLAVMKKNGEIIVKDLLPYKIKVAESFWSITGGRLLIHLEKAQERWWNKLLQQEEKIDLSTIDCSRPMNELPQDHIDKIRELQWNQEQKLKGLPTSDELRKLEILKKAWNIEGSPFKGTEFNPNVLYK